MIREEQTLAELVAEKLQELAEKSERVPELMDAQEAAAFLRLSYDKFRHIAPDLPRHKVSARRVVYSRQELLQWVLEQPPY